MARYRLAWWRGEESRRRTHPGMDKRPGRLRLECLEDRAVPATFTVNTTLDDVIPANGKLSLREAITKANTTAGADVIVVPTGVFKITLVGAGENGNLTGDFDITGYGDHPGGRRGPHDHRRPAARPGLRRGGHGSEFDRGRGGEADDPQRERDRPRRGRPGRECEPGCARLRRDREPGIPDRRRHLQRSPRPGRGASSSSAPLSVRNVAGTDGGGIAFTAGVTSSVLTVNEQHGPAQRRRGNLGGGINADTVTLTNSTVSGNTAASAGGGIYATARRR